MDDQRRVRQVMRELGVRLEDVARRTGIDMSYVGKQVRGDRPMSREVSEALADLLMGKAIACLTFTAMVLREQDEPGAAEVCEMVWERMAAKSLETPSQREVDA